MNEQSVKNFCNNYMNKKKGYSAEIHEYHEGATTIVFDVYILKNHQIKATQPMRINKTSTLSQESQLRSQIEKFSAAVENNRL